MNKRLSRLLPIEIIVDLFILTAIFVAMVAGFLIVTQTLNGVVIN